MVNGFADGWDRPLVLVVADNALVAAEAEEAVTLAGLESVGRVSLAAAVERMIDISTLKAVLIELADVPDALADDVLTRIDVLARDRGIPMVVSFARAQIDQVAARVLRRDATLLCDASQADRVAALAVARHQPETHPDVHDEDERLRQLNNEVARIADTLARLAREVGPRKGPPGLAEDSLRYQADSGDAAPVIEAGDVRALIRARRLRASYFPGDLFADPAWDMLLDLFAAGLEHRRVSVSSLCIAAAVPGTTALRWIGTMVEAKLFERQDDPADRRRAYISLTGKTRETMARYFADVRRSGVLR
jgi:hypothetical protein